MPKKKETNSKNESKTETYTGTVEGEGTSKKKTGDKKSKTKKYDEPIDAEWREVNDNDINSGRNYINQFLLEDKNISKENLIWHYLTRPPQYITADFVMP